MYDSLRFQDICFGGVGEGHSEGHKFAAAAIGYDSQRATRNDVPIVV